MKSQPLEFLQRSKCKNKRLSNSFYESERSCCCRRRSSAPIIAKKKLSFLCRAISFLFFSWFGNSERMENIPCCKHIVEDVSRTNSTPKCNVSTDPAPLKVKLFITFIIEIQGRYIYLVSILQQLITTKKKSFCWFGKKIKRKGNKKVCDAAKKNCVIVSKKEKKSETSGYDAWHLKYLKYFPCAWN